jgi:transposase-like protein
MKKTTGTSHWDIWVTCPECGDYQKAEKENESLDDLDDSLKYKCHDFIRASNIEHIHTCEECKKEFMITDVEY